MFKKSRGSNAFFYYFLTSLLWPSNKPDLNPVDYKIWSIIQRRVKCLSFFSANRSQYPQNVIVPSPAAGLVRKQPIATEIG